MEELTFSIVTPGPGGGWTYPERVFTRDEILTCIPYPLPPGVSSWNMLPPTLLDWPIGGCVILLREGSWVHVNESLATAEKMLK